MTPVRNLPILAAFLGFLSPFITVQAATEVDGIAVVINGEPITKSAVSKAAQIQVHLYQIQNPRVPPQVLKAKVKEIEQRALDDLIDKELILSEFKARGASIREQHVTEAVERFIRERFNNDRAEFLEELDRQKLSMAQFRQIQEENIIVQAMRAANAGVDDKIVTPKEMEDWWRDHPELFSSEGRVKLRTITLPKVAKGKPSSGPSQAQLVREIQTKLRNGADFASMARTYSVDSGRNSGGERGTLSQKELHEDLSRVAFSIDLNTVSDPVDLGDFYVLVYVDAREIGKVTPLEEVQDEVRRYVLQNRRQDNEQRWLKNLREKANLVYKDATLVSR